MVFTENFSTGSDQELNSYTGWTRLYGAGVLGGFAATGRLGFTDSSNSDSCYYVSAGSFSNDQYAQAKVAALPSGATTSRINIFLRVSGSSLIHAEFINVDNTGAFTVLLVDDYVGNLASTTGTLSVNDVVRLEASGTAFVLKQNGSTILSATLAGTAAGRPGLGGKNSTASNAFRWDDFEAGDIVTGITVVPTAASLVLTTAAPLLTLSAIYSEVVSGWTLPNAPTLTGVAIDGPTQLTIAVTRGSATNTASRTQVSLNGTTGWVDNGGTDDPTSGVRVLAGLEPDTTYYVRRRNEIGAVVSAWSNIVSGRTSASSVVVAGVSPEHYLFSQGEWDLRRRALRVQER